MSKMLRDIVKQFVQELLDNAYRLDDIESAFRSVVAEVRGTRRR